MFTAIANYLRGSVEELHQVRWPTRQQAVRLSLIVIVFVAVSAAAFGIVDAALSALVKFMLSFA
ncbi:MAG: preprotein translocase subunit SecE [Candidatus Peregrinibacteria bacterium]